MNEVQIKCDNVSKKYFSKRKSFYAVSDINLQVSRNEWVLLKGRSGAGKSTLLNLMCGLIKPTGGAIRIGDYCITELANHTLSTLLLNQLGIIFQNFNLLPTYTVFENIEIALAPKGLKQKKIREIIMPYLEQFELEDKSELLPSDLSVGQQQKVAVIRTLVKQPSVIFADEPTGSVDDETASEIIRHFLFMKREKQVTIIVATHGSFPETYADRIITIDNGQIKS
jgi:putative ABC transport system ATP-binding protein